MADARDAEIDDLINNLDRDYDFHPGGKDNAGYGRDQADNKQQDLQKLLNLWIAERTCPDILPYDEELISTLTDRLRAQVEFIEMTTTDPEAASQSKLKILLVESELERIKFLIRGYVRARMHKVKIYMFVSFCFLIFLMLIVVWQIDKYYLHLSTQDTDTKRKLSDAEQRFVLR